jgi:hypothetical protein
MATVTRTLIIGTLFLTLIALPAGAFAQSAGDDQYSDPLAPTEQPADRGQSAPAPGPPTPAPAPAQSTPVTSSPSTDDSSASPRGTLPRTGLSIPLLLVLAMPLLISGIMLRRCASPAQPSS